jgi:hypothetical protein
VAAIIVIVCFMPDSFAAVSAAGTLDRARNRRRRRAVHSNAAGSSAVCFGGQQVFVAWNEVVFVRDEADLGGAQFTPEMRNRGAQLAHKMP